MALRSDLSGPLCYMIILVPNELLLPSVFWPDKLAVNMSFVMTTASFRKVKEPSKKAVAKVRAHKENAIQ